MLCQILKRSMPYSINCILNCIHGTISNKSIVFASEQWDYKVFFPLLLQNIFLYFLNFPHWTKVIRKKSNYFFKKCWETWIFTCQRMKLYPYLIPPTKINLKWMKDLNIRLETVAETSTRETKHHTWRIGELRFIMLGGPEELTLQALSPEQRDYRVLIDCSGQH